MKRRKFIALAILSAVPSMERGLSAQTLLNIAEEDQQGGEDAPVEQLKIRSIAARRVLQLRSQAMSEVEVREKISEKDRKKFAFGLLRIAESHAERRFSRKKDPAQIDEYLNLFDLDPDKDLRQGTGKTGELIPFCACGLSYVASLAFAHIPNLTQLAVVKQAAVSVTRSHFLCDPCVAEIRDDAKRRNTWRAPSVAPKPGWLIHYRFPKGNHIGIVRDFRGDTIETVEFNTTGLTGDERNGGCVLVKTRPNNESIKGYVALY
jgi:hypothetical protein